MPRVTLVTRKSYGGAYIAMNSRSLGATRVFAWPGAEIAVMGPLAAVRILHRRRLAEVAPEPARPGGGRVSPPSTSGSPAAWSARSRSASWTRSSVRPRPAPRSRGHCWTRCTPTAYVAGSTATSPSDDSPQTHRRPRRDRAGAFCFGFQGLVRRPGAASAPGRPRRRAGRSPGSSSQGLPSRLCRSRSPGSPRRGPRARRRP
nr:carboxyl transferase domain-containing protein [Nocardioides convexus]